MNQASKFYRFFAIGTCVVAVINGAGAIIFYKNNGEVETSQYILSVPGILWIAISIAAIVVFIKDGRLRDIWLPAIYLAYYIGMTIFSLVGATALYAQHHSKDAIKLIAGPLAYIDIFLEGIIISVNLYFMKLWKKEQPEGDAALPPAAGN